MALSDLLELTLLLLLLPLLERLSAEDCPCSEASLCRPIRHHRDFEVSIPFARRSDTVGCREVVRSLSSLPLFRFPSV